MVHERDGCGVASSPHGAHDPAMHSSRRSFLAGSAAAGMFGSFGLSSCAARPARPPRDPASKARLLVIGCGNRGAENLASVAGEDLRWLCDVDRDVLAAAGKQHPGARCIEDFRTVLGDPAACRELDGVVVSTPDHTHYPAAMQALQQGLDVYCEKPLTRTVAQARRLLETAQANGCVTQMGIQIHANDNYRRVVEAIRGGAVGAVREVIVWCGTNWSASELPPDGEVPARLAWDLWLGPAAPRPFSAGYHPMGWRRYWAFGGGSTGDMGCHYVDLAFWALLLDAPTSLQADGPEPHPECAPAALRCEYAFPARAARPAVTLRWHSAGDRPQQELAARGLEGWGNGVLFVGDDGWLCSDYGKHTIGPDARRASWQVPAPSIPKSPGHHREWLLGMAARTQPSCSFAYAVPLTETVLLANVAYRAARGRRIAWDAAAMRTDDAAANALLDEPGRPGWLA